MPARSRRQQRFFGFLKAHPEEARRRGIPQSVVEEFARAPRGKPLPESKGERQVRRKRGGS